jgi:hypothetical protein
MLSSFATALTLLIRPPDCTMMPGAGVQTLDLQPTGSLAAATGRVDLREVDASGTFDAGVSVRNLPEAGSFGPYRVWVVWAVSPSLDWIIKVGSVSNTDTLRARVDSGTPMFLVSAEPDTAVTKFHALVLVGRCMPRPVNR